MRFVTTYWNPVSSHLEAQGTGQGPTSASEAQSHLCTAGVKGSKEHVYQPTSCPLPLYRCGD